MLSNSTPFSLIPIIQNVSKLHRICGRPPINEQIHAFDTTVHGKHVKGTVNGVSTVYIAGIFEYQNGAITKYYPGAGGSSAMRRENYAADNGIFYVLGDHLGSTSTIIQQDTTVVKQEFYYPFGGNRGSAFSEITTKRFTGQYHEAGLPGGEGLSYYNARWYDAQIGRFISADTLIPNPAIPQAFNRLSYVSNNPLKYTDPSGHRLACGATLDSCGGTPRPNSSPSTNPHSNNPRRVRAETLTLQRSPEQRRAQRWFTQHQAEQRWLRNSQKPADSDFNPFGGPMTSSRCDEPGRPSCDARHPSADSLTGKTNLGDPIYAIADGIVVQTGEPPNGAFDGQGNAGGFGYFVLIEHDVAGAKLYSVYAHNGEILVAEGAIVSAGDQIATMGKSGTRIVHLHFEIRRAVNVDLGATNPFETQIYWPSTVTELKTNFVDLGPVFGYHSTYNNWATHNR